MFIIRAKIAASETSGMFARDWFNCGVNDASEHYATAEQATQAAIAAYRGPDIDGIGCLYWPELIAE